MVLYTDSEGRIKDVGNTNDKSLTEVYISDENNPFKDWTDAKICCYKISVDEEGNITMLTPYVDSRLIDFIDKYGTETQKNEANIDYISMMTGVDLPSEV